MSRYSSKKWLLICLCMITFTGFSSGDTIIDQNFGSDDWDYAGQPYIVRGDITCTGFLTIEEGVDVLFDRESSLTIAGRLVATGNPTSDFEEGGITYFGSRIKFAPEVSGYEWDGLIFSNTNDTEISILENCYIIGADIGIDVRNSYPIMRYNHIESCGEGIHIEFIASASHTEIVYAIMNFIYDFDDYGIYVDADIYDAKVSLKNNILTGEGSSGTGIFVTSSTGDPDILVHNNSCDKIGYDYGGVGIGVGNITGVDVQNCILSECGYPVDNQSGTTLNINYNVFISNNHPPTGTVISLPVGYTSDLLCYVGNGDYHLLDGSFPINHGNSSETFNDLVDGTRNDLGCFGGPDGMWELQGDISGELTHLWAPYRVMPGENDILRVESCNERSWFKVCPGADLWFEPDVGIEVRSSFSASGSADDDLIFVGMPSSEYTDTYAWGWIDFQSGLPDNSGFDKCSFDNSKGIRAVNTILEFGITECIFTRNYNNVVENNFVIELINSPSDLISNTIQDGDNVFYFYQSDLSGNSIFDNEIDKIEGGVMYAVGSTLTFNANYINNPVNEPSGTDCEIFHLDNCDAVIIDNELENFHRGALYAIGSDITFRNNTMINSQTEPSGFGCSTLSLYQCDAEINDNTIENIKGGELYAEQSNLTFDNNTMTNWQNDQSGLACNAVDLVMSTGTISNNAIPHPNILADQTAEITGIFCRAAPGVVTISGNFIEPGGMYPGVDIGMKIEDCLYDVFLLDNEIELCNNEPANAGGGVYISNSRVTLYRNYIRNNNHRGLRAEYSRVFMNSGKRNEIDQCGIELDILDLTHLNMDHGLNDIDGSDCLGSNISEHTALAVGNWWGHIGGPFAAERYLEGDWEYDPWCESEQVDSVDPAETLFAEAQSMFEEEDYAEAEAVLTEIVQIYPNSIWAQYSLGSILSCHNKVYGDASNLVDYFGDLSDTFENTDLGFEAVLMKSRCYTADDQFIDALDICDDAQSSAQTLVNFASACQEEAYCELMQNLNSPGIQSANTGLDDILAAHRQKLENIGKILSGETPWTPPMLIDDFKLGESYPNPFNNETVIPYALPDKSEVTITVYNNLGCQVTALFSGIQTSGTYEIAWKAGNTASGIYFIKMEAKSVVSNTTFSDIRKTILLK